MIRQLTKAAFEQDRETFDSLLENLYYESVSKGLVSLSLPQELATAVKVSFRFPFAAAFSFGLTAPQLQAIQNYEQRLLEGDMKALKAKLRDKRYDRTLLKDRTRPVDEQRVGRMVDSYRVRTRRSQARKLARTAITMTKENAKWNAALHVYKNLGVEVEKLWRGGSARHSEHAALGYVDLFYNYGTGKELFRYAGDPSAGIQNVVSCACRMSYRIKR